MTELALYQVDAFSDAVFAGNPAAVCPLDDWLPDETLQAIARENNLSETAFFVPNGAGYHLRWFTPAFEVRLCGHATLASAFVITRLLKPETDRVQFETASGPLIVSRQGEAFTMDFPAQPPEPFNDGDAVFEILGFRPQAVLASEKMMAVLASEAEVREAEPHMERIKHLPVKGLILTAEGEDCDFVSRYFASHAGIPEDPVTGSAHCVMAPYWAERLGKTVMQARQISARGGSLTVEHRGERVLLTGKAALYLEGRIRV